ncbi:hypothetical protein GUJ93_ZPchr0002g25288 [Zizania palustris]|uniref:BHLH domain-containing protein n=1 Tax=Zizania palustris TaxID=103762 RepID=A0A8J5S9M4_ZIZPA|nr:hypothetical protein GUJ93_ZPchr0002g25288 [Zizania palustris]
MAQQGTNSGSDAPAAAADSAGSMGSGHEEGSGESQTGSHLVVSSAAADVVDKGKGVVGNDEERQGGSQGSTAAGSSAARQQGRAGGRRRYGRKDHVQAERQRRQRMKDRFNDLQALVPNLPTRIDKASIVVEAIDFIKSLQETVTNLERRKMERDIVARVSSSAVLAPPLTTPAQAIVPVVARSWSMPAASGGQAVLSPAGAHRGRSPVIPAAAPAPSVVVNWCGDEHAFIDIRAPRLTRRHDVLTMVMGVLEKHSINVVTAQIDSDDSQSKFTIHTCVNRESGLAMETVTTEGIYQLAVSEIMVWLTS